MKIQTRCLAGIVPVFVVLAAAVGFLVDTLERRESLWGVREEASGLAISIAAFVDGADLLKVVAGGTEAAEREAFLKPLERVLKDGKTDRLFALRPSDGRILLDMGPAAASNGQFRVPDAVLAGALAGESFVTPVETEAGRKVIRAFAPVCNRTGTVLAVLGIQNDVTFLAGQGELSRERIFQGAAATVLVGLLCSLLISVILTRSIRILNDAVTLAGAGQFDSGTDTGRGIIHEFRDLWNTFETMMSVLRGVIAKTKRDLLGVEMFRSEQDLVAVLNEPMATGLERSAGGVDFCVKAVQGGSPGNVMDLFESGGRVFGVLGSLTGGKRDLPAALTASAARRYWRQRLGGGDGAKARQEGVTLFAFADLLVVEFDPARKELAAHRYDPAQRRFESRAEPLPAKAVRCFHNLGVEADRRMGLYLEHFGDQPATTLVDELRLAILPTEPPPGRLLMVVRS